MVEKLDGMEWRMEWKQEGMERRCLGGMEGRRRPGRARRDGSFGQANHHPRHSRRWGQAALRSWDSEVWVRLWRPEKPANAGLSTTRVTAVWWPGGAGGAGGRRLNRRRDRWCRRRWRQSRNGGLSLAMVVTGGLVVTVGLVGPGRKAEAPEVMAEWVGGMVDGGNGGQWWGDEKGGRK